MERGLEWPLVFKDATAEALATATLPPVDELID